MRKRIKELLDAKWETYEVHDFVKDDPIRIPEQFSRKEDKEISGFLAATIAWGQRPTILKNAQSLAERMDHSPYEFIMEAGQKEFKALKGFVHRTFNEVDLFYFVEALQRLYKEGEGLEAAFAEGYQNTGSMKGAIGHFRSKFFELGPPGRTSKHVSDPERGSSAKRINMFLRWMVRSSERGVDFGIWKSIPASALMLPLDTHTGNIARKLGILERKQNDWKAVEEVMEELRKMDPNDPVKYDFALFGMGVYEKEEYGG